jgi:hypothetical protein
MWGGGDVAGDLRSSILTTAAVAVSVAGLTVIQPLTAAPPLLLAALLMDGGSGDIDGVGGIADAIQGRLLPSDGRAVIVNFLTGPFSMWNPLDESDGSYGTVPSTTLGVAGSMPFLNQQGWSVTPPALPPLAPGLPPAVPPAQVLPAPVVSFDVPSLQIGESIVTPPPAEPVPAPGPGDVVTSYKFGLGSYATVTLLNPITLTNTVAEYLNRALSPVRVNPDGTVTCRGLSCDDLGVTTERVGDVLYVTFKNPDGTLVKAKVETRNGVTYVTYDDEGSLPLVRPLRDYFGLFGNELADIIEPALTALVYWGYRDATDGTGNSILPTPAETIKAVLDFLVGVKEGIESLFVAHSPATDNSLARAEDADEEADVPATEEDDEPSDGPEPSTPSEPSEDPQDEVTPPAEETPAEEQPAEDEPTPEEPTTEEPADDEATEDTPDDDEPAEDTPATDPKDDESDDGDDKDRGKYTDHRDRDKEDKETDSESDKDDDTSSPSETQ